MKIKTLKIGILLQKWIKNRHFIAFFRASSPVTSTTKKASDIYSLAFFVFKSDTEFEGM